MTEEIKSKTDRVAVYIDGFNLYFGMKSKNWKKYYWLGMWEFGNFLAKERSLVSVKYFTADVTGNSGKVRRQQTFFNALKAHSPMLDIIKGKYQQKPRRCHHCLQTITVSEEKMTDVNIATHLLNDAWNDLFDVAIVVSGDSDLVPPIKTVKREFPEKGIFVAFPPLRVSHHLKQTTTWFHINEKAFRVSQMPNTVAKSDNTELHRPTSWQ